MTASQYKENICTERHRKSYGLQDEKKYVFFLPSERGDPQLSSHVEHLGASLDRNGSEK